MKKLLLLAAFGLFASPAFAQNTSTVNQNGTDYSAHVTQTGDLHTATVNQGNGSSASREGEVVIEQAGLNNTAQADQMGGRDKVIDIYQSGADNNASVNQSNGSNYVEPTRATQSQTGDRNRAEITQMGRRVSASQTQFGDDNQAYITQASYVDAGQGQGDEAGSSQEGNHNYAEIEFQGQNFAGPRSQAFATQHGDYNISWMRQQGQRGNIMTHGQFGNDNVARARQDGAVNSMTATQTGDGNKIAGVSGSTVDDLTFEELTAGQQSGDENLLSVMQTGNSNVVGFFQQNGATATVNQSGDTNTALLHQDGGNLGTITQLGAENQAVVCQGGGC